MATSTKKKASARKAVAKKVPVREDRRVKAEILKSEAAALAETVRQDKTIAKHAKTIDRLTAELAETVDQRDALAARIDDMEAATKNARLARTEADMVATDAVRERVESDLAATRAKKAEQVAKLYADQQADAALRHEKAANAANDQSSDLAASVARLRRENGVLQDYANSSKLRQLFSPSPRCYVPKQND